MTSDRGNKSVRPRDSRRVRTIRRFNRYASDAVFLDLPFHPFRIEQRCGRFDRIGQQHAVSTLGGVTNLEELLH